AAGRRKSGNRTTAVGAFALEHVDSIYAGPNSAKMTGQFNYPPERGGILARTGWRAGPQRNRNATEVQPRTHIMLGSAHSARRKDIAMARATAGEPLAAGLALALALTVSAGQAHAQASFEAAYTIAAARIPVGNATLSGSVGPDAYAMSMSGQTSGLLRVLASGEGSMAVTGIVSGGKVSPQRYTSKTTADDDTLAVTMTFRDGNVYELEATQPPPG